MNFKRILTLTFILLCLSGCTSKSKSVNYDSDVYEELSKIDPLISGYVRFVNKGEYYHIITEVHSIKASQIDISSSTLRDFLNTLLEAGAHPASVNEQVQEEDYYEKTTGASALTINSIVIDDQYLSKVIEEATKYEFQLDYIMGDFYSYETYMELEVILE